MKRVIDLSIGGLKFSLEEDAYQHLNKYLQAFEKTIENALDREEVMQDIEGRVAEIFKQEQKFSDQVITSKVVQVVIGYLGEIDILEEKANEAYSAYDSEASYTIGKKKLYRSNDGKMLAGVCTGAAIYFDVDPTIVRILLVLLIIFGFVGVIVYVVLWIVIPKATTVVQELELRGYAPTADNIRKFKAENKYA